jgi:hypothetical protein
MVVAAGLVLGGGAAAAAFLVMRGSPDRIVHMIPSTADVVVTAYLDPAASQKANLLALAQKFPALTENGGVGAAVNRAIDEALAVSGITHADVLPWLGSQISTIVSFDPDSFRPSYAVLIDTDDADAADKTLTKLTEQESLEPHTYKGVETHVGSDGAWAIVDGVAVLTDDATLLTTIIDTSNGDAGAIVDDERFESTLAALPEAKLGYVYVNPARVLQQFTATAAGLGLDGSSAPGLAAIEAYRSIGVSLSAAADGIAIDVTVRLDPSKLDAATKELLDAPTHDNAMLGLVPGDAYAVFSQENVDRSLQQALEQISTVAPGEIPPQFGVNEFLSSLSGDVAVEVSPGAEGPVGAAVLLGIDTTAPAQKTLDALARTIVPLLESEYSAPSLSKHDVKELEKLGVDPSEFETPQPSIHWRSTSYQGVTITYLDHSDLAPLGIAPAYAVLDGAAVIASDPGEIERIINVQNGGAAVTGAPGYLDAAGRVPGGASAYVDIEAVVAAVRGVLPAEAQAAFDQDAGPNLAPVKTVVTGTENSSSGSTTRIFVVIR